MSQPTSTPKNSPRHLVVMGVSGVGKTTVAKLLASRLGYEFAEGDDFHPPENVEKMSSGEPLDDGDRMPWLRSLAGWMRQKSDIGTPTVVTCSALRRRYRDVLRDGAPGIYFVHLVGEQSMLLDRMGKRQHFMPPALLQSQFDALEPLEPDEEGVVVEVTGPPERIVDKVIDELSLA
jgi:gluconokinase